MLLLKTESESQKLRNCTGSFNLRDHYLHVGYAWRLQSYFWLHVYDCRCPVYYVSQIKYLHDFMSHHKLLIDRWIFAWDSPKLYTMDGRLTCEWIWGAYLVNRQVSNKSRVWYMSGNFCTWKLLWNQQIKEKWAYDLSWGMHIFSCRIILPQHWKSLLRVYVYWFTPNS